MNHDETPREHLAIPKSRSLDGVAAAETDVAVLPVAERAVVTGDGTANRNEVDDDGVEAADEGADSAAARGAGGIGGCCGCCTEERLPFRAGVWAAVGVAVGMRMTSDGMAAAAADGRATGVKGSATTFIMSLELELAFAFAFELTLSAEESATVVMASGFGVAAAEPGSRSTSEMEELRGRGGSESGCDCDCDCDSGRV